MDDILQTMRNTGSLCEFEYIVRKEAIQEPSKDHRAQAALLGSPTNLTVRETGACELDVLVGCIPSTKGGIMQLYWIGDTGFGLQIDSLGNERDESVPVACGLDKRSKRVFSPSIHHAQALVQSVEHRKTFGGLLSHYVQYQLVEEHTSITDKVLERQTTLCDKLANHRSVGEWDTRWRLRVYALPESLVEDINNEDIVADIIKRPYPYWHVSELMQLVMNVRCKPRTLAFMRGAWRVSLETTIAETFGGLCFHIETCTTSIGGTQVYVLHDIPSEYRLGKSVQSNGRIGISASIGYRSVRTTLQWLLDLGFEQTVANDHIQCLDEMMEQYPFSVSFLASAVQKLIRFRTAYCVIKPNHIGDSAPSKRKLDCRIVLVYCILRLLEGPGHFVPNIQRFVRGPEKMAKRLAVIAFEDSDPDADVLADEPESTAKHATKDVIVSLLASALLSQRIPLWFPSVPVIHLWLRVALRLHASRTAMVYADRPTCPPYVLPWSPEVVSTKKQSVARRDDAFELSAALLRSIGSFSGDMNMVDVIATDKCRYTSSQRMPDTNVPPLRFPEHAIDQHIYPNIALLFKQAYAGSANRSLPFAPVLARLFHEYTGLNPRRTKDEPLIGSMNTNTFIKDAQSAQSRLLMLLQSPKVRLDVSPKKQKCEHGHTRRPPLVRTKTMHVSTTVDYEWLAAMLGPIDVGRIGGHSMIVTLNPYDLNELIVGIKPVVRGQSEDTIDSVLHDTRVQSKAIASARNALATGNLTLKAVAQSNLPNPMLYGCQVKLHTDAKTSQHTYFVQVNDEWMSWEDARTFTRSVHIVEEPRTCLFQTRGQNVILGQVVNKNDRLRKVCEGYSADVLRRVHYYISHSRTCFSMNKVSRDGGTQSGPGNFTVSVHDANAYKCMLTFTKFASNALVVDAGHPFTFRVTDVVALSEIREIVSECLRQSTRTYMTSDTSGSKHTWPAIEDRLGRTLLDFQENAVSSMVRSHTKGRHAHFLNIKVGLGKTLIFLTYLQRRGLTDVRHVVYTMPKSAFGGVLREMMEMGLNVDVLTGKKTASADSEAWTRLGQTHTKECAHDNGARIRVVSTARQCQAYRIIVIEHDTLRKVKHDLMTFMPRALFAIDEVHKCMYTGTQRTGATLELAKASLECVAFTGTPVLNAGSGKLLIPYMEMIVPFNVNTRNFTVAANAMVAYKMETGVGRKETLIDPWDHNCTKTSQEQRIRHDALLFGHNGSPGGDLTGALALCYEACTPVMIQETLARVETQEGVLLVANTTEHQRQLAKALIDAVRNRECFPKTPLRIFCMSLSADGFPTAETTHAHVTVRSDLHLTNDAVQQGREVDYSVVIVRRDQCEGYTATRLGAMVSSVYFTNQATREQMRGRIDRITQHRLAKDGLFVEYVTVRCGILHTIARHYGKAALLSKAMAGKRLGKQDQLKLQRLVKQSSHS